MNASTTSDASPVANAAGDFRSLPVATSTRTSNENNFDLIRLLAATQVAVKHCMVHLDVDSRYIDLLSIFPGVPIFFFISGYLIFQSFRNSGNVSRFSVNRLLRIYPALVACFVFSVGVVLFTGFLKPEQLVSKAFLAWAAAQLTIVQIYNPEFLRGFGVGVLNGSLWTISVELQFYLLTPLLAWLTLRRHWAWAVVLALGAAANIVMTMGPDAGFLAKLFSVSSPPWFYMFVLGAWLSDRPDWQTRVRAIGVWPALSVYLAVAALGWLVGWPVTGNEINPVSYLFLAAFIFTLAYSRPQLAGRLLRRNDISYGVYIYHMPIVNWFVFKHWAGRPGFVAAAMLATFALAALSWFVVERPALRRKHLTLRQY